MTSFQSTLGEEGDIAEELAENQRAISIAEFFEKNKHMLGFDSGARGLVTAVKEAVDNALDAAEEAGIHPDVFVQIDDEGDYYRLVVDDNGPGITKDQLPKIFGKLLYGSRFHSREQNRGQQGIGISAAVLYSQLTSGKPAKIESRTQGSDTVQYFELIVDTDENEPEIKYEEERRPSESSLRGTHGTRIELEMEGNMRARQQLHDYVKHTAVVNPHARVELQEPKEHMKFDRVDGAELPKETEEIRPHPHGVELGTVMKMLSATDSYSVSGFLQGEFTRVGQKTAEKVQDNFRDRYFGREMSWPTPGDHEAVDLARAVANATANKGKEATRAFGDRVANNVGDADRIAHWQLVQRVDNAADFVENEYGSTFGSTVRENAVEAAWKQITGAAFADADEGEDRRRATLYRLVDDATSKRKDDATVEGLAERIASKFRNADDHRDRATHATVAEYVERAAEMTEEREDATVGETAREKILDAIWTNMRTVPDDVPNVSTLADSRDAASDLVEAMRETDIIAPPTSCLSPITAELVEAGLRKEYDADFYAAATRDAGVSSGDPFIVEAGIAYGGDLPADGQADVMRFANRVPLVYQRGACATTDVVKSIGWRNYNLDQPGGSGIPNGPAVIMVHVASTNVPFTSESKDAVANVPEIEDEIELAIREAARELKSYLNKRKSMQKRRQKQNVLQDILPRMATKVSEVTGQQEPNIDDALARIMNNVLVERDVADGDGGQRVTITVENHDSSGERVEVTDIVSAEPTGLNGDARVVEMDGEWFVKWDVDVDGDGEASITYETSADATYDMQVDGVEDAKLTVNE
jgi:DNA topoisomerase-6 subunit B